MAITSMAKRDGFDLLFIGGGPASQRAAVQASKLGKRAADTSSKIAQTDQTNAAFAQAVFSRAKVVTISGVPIWRIRSSCLGMYFPWRLYEG